MRSLVFYAILIFTLTIQIIAHQIKARQDLWTATMEATEEMQEQAALEQSVQRLIDAIWVSVSNGAKDAIKEADY
jgi:hypothetical protein